ncbi:MAG TPA: DUF4235 domain-containing protein [Trebonia sp.]|nr:DUF4235 domain-containing protein [Trebonia sp.]
MSKILFKPISLLVGVLGGMIASAIFKKVWQLAAGEDEAPEATDPKRGWPEVIMAAALQGAIFATVRAVVNRATAEGAGKLTGSWSAEKAEAEAEAESEAA